MHDISQIFVVNLWLLYYCSNFISHTLQIFRMACNPPKYSDLGKEAKDLLNKNYCKLHFIFTSVCHSIRLFEFILAAYWLKFDFIH